MELIEACGIFKSFLDTSRISMLNIILDKNLEKTNILKNVSFKLSKGIFLGVLGRNGAGKSTLLKVIGGVYAPDSGRVIVNGKIASIFELGSFFNVELTGRRYCRDYLGFFGYGGKEAENILEDIHEFTELGDFFFQPIKTYSSGMQAKLLFAVVTSLKADIILIDEFLIVGDEYFQGKAWSRLRRFLKQGASGIMVSHDWESLMKLTQKAMILEKNNGVTFFDDTDKTVQKYLGMQFIKSNEVSFCDRHRLLDNNLNYEKDMPFEFFFSFEVLKEIEEAYVAVSFSIEKYEVGKGWYGMMNGTKTIEVIKNKNLYNVKISILDLILQSGKYVLSLTLHTPIKNGKSSTDKIFEELSLLNGSGIKFSVGVTADSNEAIFRKKTTWTR